MIISIDGPIGSGKTTLTALLASAFKGVDYRFTRNPHDDLEDLHSDIVGHVEMLSKAREFVKESAPESNRSNAMFLFNLMRVLLVEDKLTFIDSFWDPFWTFEAKYYETYYKIMNQFTEVPKLSLFLKIDEKEAQNRAQFRTREINYDFDTDALKTKRRAFLSFARENIPNFRILQADVPVSHVFQQASSIVQEVLSIAIPIDVSQTDVSQPVAMPVLQQDRIISLRQRSLQRQQ